MANLTTCLQKVGAKLDPADKAAVMARSRELRTLAKERGEPMSATDAAIQAAKDVISEIRAELKAAEPAQPAQRKSAHPKTVMGSELLAIVSARLGGLDPSLISEFSVNVPTGKFYKNGVERTEWRNPMIPGVGKLFRRGGRQDRQEIAQVLEDADYLEPGAVANDYKEAGERAKELIKAALDRNIPKTLSEQQADMEASQEAERKAYYDALDEESAAEADAERAAIMAEAGMGRVEMAAVDDADLFNMAGGTTDTATQMRAMRFTEQEIADELAREAQVAAAAAQASPGQDAQAGPEAAPAAGPAGVAAAQRGSEPAEGLTLEAQTPESLESDSTRKKAAAEADAKEQKRLAAKAKADAERDEFSLPGSDRPADVAAAAGQGDIFDQPAAPPAPPRFAGNKVFTQSDVDAARALLKKKLGQLNSGIDPELMQAGITIAGAYIESGVRKFADFARVMVDDLGDRVKPYLHSWYMALRADPRSAAFRDEMDRASAVEDLDVDAVLAAPKAEPAKQAATGKIDDFGEKLPPARRNMAAKLDETLSDSDIANRPLSEIWPLAENEAIEDTFAAAVAHAARAEVPAKPRVAYKLKQWVEKVKTVRGLAAHVVSGRLTRERLRDEGGYKLRDWVSKVFLLEQLPRDQWKRIGAVEERPDSFNYKDGKQIPSPMLRLTVDGKSHWLNGDGTVNGNLSEIRALLGDAAPEKRMEFEIRGPNGGPYKVNKKGDGKYRPLMTFKTTAEAREAIEDDYAGLVAAWEAVKDRDNITERDLRTAENRPRAGKDWRNGKDATPDQFQEQFGFKGGEFGRWVRQGKGDKERQALLNSAYDALMDLAQIAGVPPRALSLNGTLGIAFGSRGAGWASAHFEPSNLVINLTKTRGAGALAHEWFHALDNYFSRMRRGGAEAPYTGSQTQYRDDNYITHKPEALMVRKDRSRYFQPMTKGKLEAMHEARKDKTDNYSPEKWERDPTNPENVRPEVEQRFAALVQALNDSPMTKRAALLDEGSGYWSRTLERAARSFENYVQARMHEDGYHNDFLANVRSAPDTGKNAAHYPYLLPGEIKPVADAFGALFSEIKTKADDAGNVALLSQRPGSAYDQAFQRAVLGEATADDRRTIQSRPGYGNRAETALAGNVDAARALRGELEAAFGTNGGPFLDSRRGAIAVQSVWLRSASDADLARLTEAADRFNAPIIARGLESQDSPAFVKRMRAAGFETYTGMLEAGDRNVRDVAIAMVRPGGGITATTPLFSRGLGRGTPLSTLKPHIDAITAKMPGLRNAVTVVGTVTDLPQGIVDSLRSMNALGTVRGLRMPDGRVFLVADKLDSQLEAEFVLFHEVYGHEGLRAILNTEEYARAMTLVRLSNKAVAAEADAWMASYGAGQIEARVQAGMTPEAARREVRLLAIEEALADRAGKNDPPAVWKNVMAAIQKALRRMGMDDLANWLENRTEAETYALLMQARKAITNPKKPHAFTPTTSPLFQRVWHGTPHEFEKFDTSKIGTGEGAQAYGYGLYFASRREVAEHYRKALSKRGVVRVNGKELAEQHGMFAAQIRNIADAMDDGVSFEDARKQAVGDMQFRESLSRRNGYADDEKEAAAAVASLKALTTSNWTTKSGQLLEVEIPEDGEMLLWDRPLSDQPEGVRKAAEQAFRVGLYRPATAEQKAEIGRMTGEQAYRKLAGDALEEAARGGMPPAGMAPDKIASDALAARGIKGIKYLDGVSRNKPLRDVKREFLAELPEDAGFDEVMDLIGSGTFSQKNEAVLRALADNDWLGFDYPAQAISTALSSQLSNFDPSPELVQAVAATQDDSTYNYVIFSGDDVAIQQALLSRRPPPLAPAVTVQPDANGNPEFAGDGVVLAYPQPAERFEFIPGPGQRLLNYAIMPATGFDSMGFVELVVENGRVTSLMDIEISGAGRRAGVGRKVIETILAANPDADVNISNIVHQARGFWAKMGVPEQNLEDGAAYDGTLNWQAYAQAANDGRAAQVGQGMRGETGADDGRRQGAGRGAEGGAQAPVLSQRDPTQTPAFERWFGDSKVVDAQGKPLVVYHGTNQDFDSFSEERQSSKTGNPNAQLGYFFTDSPGEASRYAKAWGTTGGNVMPVYLAVNTPYAMPYKEFNDLAMGAWARLMAEPGYDPQAITPNDEASQRAAAARYAGHEVGAKQDAIKRRNELIAEGYDGIVVKVGGVREFIAFSPEQIKSAIGNSGAFDPSSPSILLSQKPKTEAGWAMPDGGKFDNFVHRFQDKNVDLKRSIGAIKQRVGEIADAIDAYLQEELFHGRSAKRTQDFVQTELEPLLADMKAKGIGTAQLDLYLHARHAEEANKLIAERNKDPNEGQKDIDGKVITSPLQDGGSGMLTKTARDYLAGKQVEIDGQTVTGPSGDGLKALQEVAAKVDAIINKTRVYNLAYGLISPAEAQSWATMFKHYVPLFREDKDGGMGIGQGYSIKGPEAKHRTGSTAKVVDILANIALAREKAIVRGEKNRVAVALVGLAKANPNDDIWEFGPITERRFNEQTGLVEVKMKNGWKSADNVLVAKIRTTKGAIKEVGVVFNERNERAMRMAAALKNLDAAQLEGAMAVSAVITRWFAAINTQYNPVFGFVNLVRDIGGASINLSSTPLKDKRAAVLKNIPAALWAVGRVEAGGTPGNKAMAALWEEMQNEGGMTGFRDLYRNSQDRAKDIEFALNPAAWMDGTMGKIFTAGGLLRGPASMAQFGATKLFRGLSHYNTAMEAATRLSVYKVALEQGLSKQRAASLAKNITVNFNRKGQAGLQAGALYAFFNAAVQGTARIGEVVFDTKNGQGLRITPAGLKIITGGVALGGLQALALAMAGFDDDEPPQFVREKNLIIPTGWLTGKRDYVTIPMPLGWNVLPNIGRITTEWAMSGFADPRKRAFKMVGTVLDSFNPLGNATLAQTMSPTPFDPFVALLENKDWTGKPIARQMFDKAAAGWKSSKDTATDHAKFIAKMVNYALGGTEHQGNQIWNATPDQIDYLIGQAFGGVARELGKAEQTVGALRTGEDLPAHKVPLLGRFYGNAEQSSAQASRFYENMERFDYHQAEVKGLAEAWRRANGLAVSADATDDPQYKAYLAKHPEVALISASNRAERAVQKLRKEKSQMLKDGKPRADVKEKEAEITAAMRAFNEAAKSAMRPKKAPALQE